MAWNGPPVSVPGLGSHVSSWLTPPAMKITRTRFCALSSSRAAAGWTIWPKLSAPSDPATPDRKPRRETTCSGEWQEYEQNISDVPKNALV